MFSVNYLGRPATIILAGVMGTNRDYFFGLPLALPFAAALRR